MSDKYESKEIVPIAFPQWQTSPDGVCTRHWEIRLGTVVDEQGRTALQGLSESGMKVTAEVQADGRTILVTTTTSLNPFTDEVFFASAYRMLKTIDTRVGHIDLVQGQPRRLWQPFRDDSMR